MILDRLEGRIPRRPGILIGQAPNRSGRADLPLTGGRTGGRLQELMGLSLGSYVRLFSRANLLDAWPGSGGPKGDAFPARLARIAAIEMLEAGHLRDRLVLFVGVGTARAFRFPAPPLDWAEHAGTLCACVPHPSGVNLWWNLPENERAARAFLTDLAARAKGRHDRDAARRRAEAPAGP